uniref:Uncharacterized protein n=1 Tax=Anguilla anguilla TaxID=7936 RepID=A0A0E9U419_ANGAN
MVLVHEMVWVLLCTFVLDPVAVDGRCPVPGSLLLTVVDVEPVAMPSRDN